MFSQVETPSSNCTDGVLYGTGDYVRLRRDNGLLYYEGRCDSQIKVRGHRVDLSEIEKVVSCVHGVNKAVILCYKPNEPAQKVLCFFTSEPATTETEKKVNRNETCLCFVGMYVIYYFTFQ